MPQRNPPGKPSNLLICSIYPLPETSGTNIRTMHFVRALAKIGNLDLAFTNRVGLAQLPSSLVAREYHLKTLTYPKSALLRLYNSCRNLPYPMKLFTGNEFHRMLQAINSGLYSNVVVRYLNNTSILKGVQKSQSAKVLVDLDDVITQSIYEMYFETSPSPFQALIRALNKRHVDAYQRQIMHKFRTAFCSETDLSSHRGETKMGCVIPNVYRNDDIGAYNFSDGYKNGNCLLFVGQLAYPPNVEGLKWFIDNIFKPFSMMYADAKLLVVGMTPSEEIKGVCRRYSTIELHADVKSLAPYYDMARAVVVPLLSGGGTRIKILEAALTGRPVLSTRTGAYGLDLRNGKDILLFEGLEEFIAGYERLFNEEDYRLLSNGLKNRTLQEYSPARFEDAFYRALDQAR